MRLNFVKSAFRMVSDFFSQCFILILSLVFFADCLCVAAQESKQWQTVKSTHFIVYYQNAQGDFLDGVIDKAEDYYDKIADNLGFRRFDFWLWDKRAKIYIYDDAKSYQASTGQPEWSGGCTQPKDKVISTYVHANRFLGNILPHELGHIVFREFVGFDNPAIPLWLDEGVASYQESLRRLSAGRIVRVAIDKDSLMSMDDLSSFNPASSQDAERINLFYAQSVSILDYLVKEYGSDSFICFCQNLRDKKNFLTALKSCYPFSDMKALENDWRNSLEG